MTNFLWCLFAHYGHRMLIKESNVIILYMYYVLLSPVLSVSQQGQSEEENASNSESARSSSLGQESHRPLLNSNMSASTVLELTEIRDAINLMREDLNAFKVCFIRKRLLELQSGRALYIDILPP